MSTDVAPGVGRRQFLGWGLVGTVTLAAAGTGIAAAALTPATMEVFQLEPDWGTPRGPHGKLRLLSTASRRAAANRIALNTDDALAMNLHPCSFAPARAVTVSTAAFTALWTDFSYVWHNPWANTDVRILDLRRVLADPNGAARWAAATNLAAPVLPSVPGLPGQPTSPGAASPSSTGGGAPTSESADVVFGGGDGGQGPATRGLPVTGLDLGIAKLGAGLLAAGISVMALARRRTAVHSSGDRGSTGSP
jgi:hypothetical protein